MTVKHVLEYPSFTCAGKDARVNYNVCGGQWSQVDGTLLPVHPSGGDKFLPNPSSSQGVCNEFITGRGRFSNELLTEVR